MNNLKYKKKLEQKLLLLIKVGKLLGLSSDDINNATEYIGYLEYGVAFDLLINKMHENDIEIDDDVYLLIKDLGISMVLPINEYFFMQELIRSENKIPKPVKDELSKIIDSLN